MTVDDSGSRAGERRPAKTVLLTSICRPLGEKYGDGPSVGYELLFGQVTRAQGLFSPRNPRANCIQFSLEYIAENLDAPTTVLHYPTRQELIRELRQGYDYVGVSFLLATYRHMKDIVALVRKHSPASRIVLGGYGTVLGDDVLRPHGDFICREEGVGFMRRLLGEPEARMPYRHPLVVTRLEVFGREVSQTGVVFAGLGCPNGCDFCCTSHFFKRKHVRLLPGGRDIYRVVQRYHEIDPQMPILIVDEDFLLNKRRALEFRDAVQEGAKPLSVFAFASIRALSQYTVSQILEMGIDGLWIGYEGTRAGFAKQAGRPVDEVFREFREHGISILASMIVGLPYQTPGIVEEELAGLLDTRPDLTQFMIYGPTPGTPFFDRVREAGLLHRELAEDPELYYRKCTGFAAMVNHPSMPPAQIESLQRWCFEEDFRRLGPSVYRAIETWFLGHLRLSALPGAFAQAKARRFAAEIRRSYPAFLAGRLLGPTSAVRAWTAELERRIHGHLGPPTWRDRGASVLVFGLALWTWIELRLDLFQHPKLLRRTYRQSGQSPPASAWRRLRRRDGVDLDAVEVELRPESMVWVRVEGTLGGVGAERLVAGLRRALRRTEDRVVLDLARLAKAEKEAVEQITGGLAAYRHRIRVVMPDTGDIAALAAFFALYR